MVLTFDRLVGWVEILYKGAKVAEKRIFFTIDKEEFEIQLYHFNLNFNCKIEFYFIVIAKSKISGLFIYEEICIFI